MSLAARMRSSDQAVEANRGARDHPDSLNERSTIDPLVVRVLHVRLDLDLDLVVP